MKKKIVLPICSIIFLLIISVSVVYAWYISQDRVEMLNPSTNGVVYTYSVDGEEVIDEEFNIKDIAFFDTDSTYEGKYFTDMAILATFVVTNKSTREIDIAFSYEIPSNTNPYIACFFSENADLDSSNTTGSVNDFIAENLSDNQTISSISFIDVAAEESVTVYAYIYGIQPDDAATNDFLNEVYSFKLIIDAVQS